MRPILTLIWLTLRNAMATRIIPISAGLSLALVILMPMVIQGDGTAGGDLRVLLVYAPGAAWLILAITTAITSCGLIAHEVEERTFRLVAVRPLHPCQIWLGKWSATVLVNAAILSVTGCVLLVSVHIMSARHPGDLEGIARARLAHRPEMIPVEPEVEQRMIKLREQGRLPEDPNLVRNIRYNLRQQLMGRRSTVNTRESHTWNFPLSPSLLRHIQRDRTLELQFSYTSSPLVRREAAGTWTFALPDGTREGYPVTALFDGQHLIPVPSHVVEAIVSSGGAENSRTGNGTLRALAVTFTNGNSEESIPLMFDAKLPVALMTPGGTFASNLLRALTLMLGSLAALAALGLTLGTLFSLPVAGFATACSLLAVTVANSKLAGELDSLYSPARGWFRAIYAFGDHLVAGVRMLTGPVFAADPLHHLAWGLAIPWGRVVNVVLFSVLLVPLLLGGIASFILSKRQLAS